MFKNADLFAKEKYFTDSLSQINNIPQLAEDKNDNIFLLRLAFVDAIRLYPARKKNGKTIIRFMLFIGWFYGFIRYYNKRLIITDKINIYDHRCVVFCRDTPNQLKLKDKIVDQNAGAFYMLSPSPSRKNIKTNEFIKIVKKKSVLDGLKSAINRSKTFYHLADQSRNYENIKWMAIIKFGYALSPAYDLMRNFAMELSVHYHIERAYFTYTGYWEDAMVNAFNEYNIDTVLYLHGSVGNAMMYRTLAKKTIVPHHIDASVLSKVSFSKYYEYEQKKDYFPRSNTASESILYCTNLYAAAALSIAGKHRSLKESAERCNLIVRQYALDKGMNIVLRKHPREQYRSYEESLRMEFGRHEDHPVLEPAFVIAHQSSVIFDYIEKSRVYIYIHDPNEISGEFSSLQLIASAVGFHTREELDGLTALSDSEYANRINRTIASLNSESLSEDMDIRFEKARQDANERR